MLFRKKYLHFGSRDAVGQTFKLFSFSHNKRTPCRCIVQNTHIYRITAILPSIQRVIARVGIQSQNRFVLPYLWSLSLFTRPILFFFTYISLTIHNHWLWWEICSCVRAVYVCVHTSPSSVWSLRKFQFPWDKLHFTANLFLALVCRKIGVWSTPSFTSIAHLLR